MPYVDMQKRRDAARETQRRRREKYPEENREIVRRWRASGLRWQDLFSDQNGLCYLCGDPLPDDRRFINLDHDHACCPGKRACVRCVRGLAHGSCNTLIGIASDDPDRLRMIADNLQAAQQRVAARPEPIVLF